MIRQKEYNYGNQHTHGYLQYHSPKWSQLTEIFVTKVAQKIQTKWSKFQGPEKVLHPFGLLKQDEYFQKIYFRKKT